MTALADIRMIDFSDHASGPVCSMMLADQGAEVIKIEPIGGEKSRRWGHARFGENNQFSSIYLALNRNKKSIAVLHAGREESPGLRAANALTGAAAAAGVVGVSWPQGGARPRHCSARGSNRGAR